MLLCKSSRWYTDSQRYYYYAETSRGAKFWWKKYLTTLQIIQFVVDLGFIYTSLYFGVVSNPKQCQGEIWAGWMGAALITSYLFLFIQFYINTYSAVKKQTTDKLNAAKTKKEE
jgi:fatty acid elongase 3